MSRVFRRRITSFTLPDGKHRTPDGQRVTKETQAAIAKVTVTDDYYGHVTGADGKRRLVPRCADKTASRQMLAKMATDAKLARVGLASRFEHHEKKPLADHLADYRRHLEVTGKCPEHIQKTCARIQAIVAGCKFVFLPDLDAGQVADFLHRLRSDPCRPALPPGQDDFTKRQLVEALGGVKPAKLSLVLRRENLPAQGNGKARRYPRATVEALQDRFCRGIGIGTSNGYLAAVKGFTHWLAAGEKNPRWHSDPLAGLSRLDSAVDVRHERRALDAVELQTLLAAADAGATAVEGLTGHDRSMLYAVAMTTGLRASELGSLVPTSFELATDRPTVCIRAARSKNKKTAFQPLPVDVAEALRGYLAGKPAGMTVWPGPWPARAAEMLRVDLRAAGIAYRDSEGCVVDFHALRHSYCTLLARSGVSPRVAQELARHSDIRLTMKTYTHVGLHDLSGAVESMPALLTPARREAAALSPTGTEGAPAPSCACTKPVTKHAFW